MRVLLPALLSATVLAGAKPASASLLLLFGPNGQAGTTIALPDNTGIPVAMVSVAAGDVNEPAANTAAVVTYTAVGSQKHVIGGVAWSYSAAPTGGGLIIEDGSGTTIYSISITAAGPGSMAFSPAKKGTAGTAMIVTLAAPGGTVVGKVNVLSHWTTTR